MPTLLEHRDNVKGGAFNASTEVALAFEQGVAYQSAIQAFANAVNSSTGITAADAEAMRDAYEAMGAFQEVSDDLQLQQVIGLLNAFIELDSSSQEWIADRLVSQITESSGNSWNRTDILTALHALVSEKTALNELVDDLDMVITEVKTGMDARFDTDYITVPDTLEGYKIDVFINLTSHYPKGPVTVLQWFRDSSENAAVTGTEIG